MQSPKFNRNYAAKIKEFIKHPKCERLKCCTIDGYSIAVSIDTNPGTYIYFPIECAIDDKFLSANNLFRDKEKNADKAGLSNVVISTLNLVILRMLLWTSLNLLVS